MKSILCNAMIIVLIICLSVSIAFAVEMKTATFNDWTMELPSGWSGDDDKGIYWPGEIETFMGRPPVSIHMGGIPVMSKIAFEERVKQHIDCDFTDKKEVTVEGQKGFTCNWEKSGEKHYGMFLEKSVGGVMRIISFFDCQAPVAQFADLEKSFITAVKTAKEK